MQTLTQRILLGISATYPTNTHPQALGGVAKSFVSEPSAQSAADSLSEVADLCQC